VSYIVTIRTQKPRPTDSKLRWEVLRRVDAPSLEEAVSQAFSALRAADCSVTITKRRPSPTSVSVGSPAVNHA